MIYNLFLFDSCSTMIIDRPESEFGRGRGHKYLARAGAGVTDRVAYSIFEKIKPNLENPLI